MWFIHVLHLFHPTPKLYNFFFKIKKQKKKGRNSSHTMERNKSKKTIEPVVEGCEEHTCTDLGVEDDHHCAIRGIRLERRVKLDMDIFHTF
jgi:hypothetical protein